MNIENMNVNIEHDKENEKTSWNEMFFFTYNY